MSLDKLIKMVGNQENVLSLHCKAMTADTTWLPYRGRVQTGRTGVNRETEWSRSAWGSTVQHVSHAKACQSMSNKLQIYWFYKNTCRMDQDCGRDQVPVIEDRQHEHTKVRIKYLVGYSGLVILWRRKTLLPRALLLWFEFFLWWVSKYFFLENLQRGRGIHSNSSIYVQTSS